MLKAVSIAVGGALGSLLRYYFQGWVQGSTGEWAARVAGATFPIGTLAVNTVACFVIGFLMGVFAGPHLMREEIRVGLTIGVLGGFSTFSTFGYESFSLANDGEFGLSLLYILLSCGFGLVAVWIGYRAAEHWFGV